MKMSISKTIGDILDYTNIGDNDFDVYVTYNGESVVVIGTADIIHELDYQYNDWRMYTRGTTLLGEYTYLQYCFNEYKKAMQNNLDRIYAALRQAYDPTGDYSRHETTAYKLTHEVEYGKTATNTTTDLESKTEYNSTVGDDIKTYDTVSVADAKSQSKTGNDTTTINGTTETELSGTDTTTDTRLAADNIKDIVGNNNSPQSAINDEIMLRINNDFTDIVIKGFADKYLFLLAEEG